MAMGDTRLEGARRPSALKLKYFARFIAFLLRHSTANRRISAHSLTSC